MDNLKSKLVIVFNNGHEEKRNIYAPSQAENYIKKHPDKGKITSAVWYDGGGKRVELIKVKKK